MTILHPWHRPLERFVIQSCSCKSASTLRDNRSYPALPANTYHKDIFRYLSAFHTYTCESCLKLLRDIGFRSLVALPVTARTRHLAICKQSAPTACPAWMVSEDDISRKQDDEYSSDNDYIFHHALYASLSPVLQCFSLKNPSRHVRRRLA